MIPCVNDDTPLWHALRKDDIMTEILTELGKIVGDSGVPMCVHLGPGRRLMLPKMLPLSVPRPRSYEYDHAEVDNEP